MTEDPGETAYAETGGAASGRGKPAPSFRAWAVALLAAALLSAGATLLLGGALRANSPDTDAQGGCGAGCCGLAGK